MINVQTFSWTTVDNSDLNDGIKYNKRLTILEDDAIYFWGN